MKKGIHPEYKDTTITCACGEVIQTKSTKQNLRVEICSKCHPFFTGEMRFVDTLGRVEKFQQKMASQAASGGPVLSKKARKQQKQKQEEAEKAASPKSLKEMFDRVKSR